MDILLPEPNGYYSKQKDKTDLASFVAGRVFDDNYERLERQPRKVAEFVGKLVNFMVDKGLMTPEEFYDFMYLNKRWDDEPVKDEDKFELVKD